MSKKYQEEVTKLEKQLGEKLSSILEELTDYQYKRMLTYLNKIPEQEKRKRPRGEMAQIIIQHYGLEKSIEEINENVLHICKGDRKIQDLLQPMLRKLEVVKTLKKEKTSRDLVELQVEKPCRVLADLRSGRGSRAPSLRPPGLRHSRRRNLIKSQQNLCRW